MLKIKLLIITFSFLILFLLTGCPMGRGYEPPPYLSGSISLSGSAMVGQTLTVDTANLEGSGTISYQWRRGGNQNIGANSNSYNITTDDLNHSITVTVRRTGNTGSITSAPTNIVTDPSLPALTGTVTITGTAQVGQILTANTTGLGGSGMISYQWRRDDSDVIGTSSSYTLQEADVGSTITVTVTRSVNSGSITSAATGVVTIPTYTITFNLNGGTGTVPEQQTISIGESIITLPPGTGFSRTGYLSKFDGWTTIQNDPATKVTSFIPTGNSTLYANWVSYALGDTGPTGGIIFYIDQIGFNVQGYSGGSGETTYLNFAEYTAYYLEAAPANSGENLAWASNSDLIPGLSQNTGEQTDRVIGRGRLNTAIIIARGINQPYITPAASACFNPGTDWFLPSQNELDQLYLRRNDVGITSGTFWSSSQTLSNYAFRHNFTNNLRSDITKSTGNDVRAVRAF